MVGSSKVSGGLVLQAAWSRDHVDAVNAKKGRL
jgi:hypothetical protein